MKKFFSLFIKGIIIGIGKIIPGVSGALIAISFNLYDRGLDSISNFFDNKKENIKFLLAVGSGIVLSIFIFSNIIKYFLDNYYFLTMCLFLGLIIGGILPIIKNNLKEKKLYYIVPFFLILFLSLLTISSNFNLLSSFKYSFIVYIMAGFIDAFSTIVPGVSGTAILMMLGLYDTIITAISNVNITILIPYFGSMFLSLIVIAKVMNYLFKKHYSKTMSAIMGISLATVLILLIRTFSVQYEIEELIIGIFLFLIGYYLSMKY